MPAASSVCLLPRAHRSLTRGNGGFQAIMSTFMHKALVTPHAGDKSRLSFSVASADTSRSKFRIFMAVVHLCPAIKT
jgi:hypothetical protein